MRAADPGAALAALLAGARGDDRRQDQDLRRHPRRGRAAAAELRGRPGRAELLPAQPALRRRAAGAGDRRRARGTRDCASASSSARRSPRSSGPLAEVGLDLAQFHGDEPVATVAAARAAGVEGVRGGRGGGDYAPFPRRLARLLVDRGDRDARGGTGETLALASALPRPSAAAACFVAGGLDAGDVAAARRGAGAGGVDVASGVERRRASRTTAELLRRSAFEEVAMSDADGACLTPRGHFGPYGGRYVPETLMAAARRARGGLRRGCARDRAFRRRARASCCATTRAGRRRSTSRDRLQRASSAARGSTSSARTCPHRRAQDQQRARPGAAGAAHGQAAHHRRDRRRASTAWPRPRLRAARPGVRGLHGRGGHAAPGAERLPHAPARRRGACRSTPAAARSRTPSTRRCATG